MKNLERAVEHLRSLEPDFDDEGMVDDHEYERQLGQAASLELAEAKLWRQRALNAEEIVRELRSDRKRKLTDAIKGI